MSEAFFNQWTGTLQADVAATDVAMSVAPVPKGPARDDTWRLRMGSELCKVTRSVDNGNGTATLTIVRGVETTTPATHRKGSSAASVLTAEAVQSLSENAVSQALAKVNQGPDPLLYVKRPSERLFLASNFS